MDTAAQERISRWDQEGLAGLSDDQQPLCCELALWNGQAPIRQDARMPFSCTHHCSPVLDTDGRARM
jgi:hypothetical protein